MNGCDANSDALPTTATSTTRVQPTMSAKYNERSSFQRKLNMVRVSWVLLCLRWWSRR